MRMEIPIDTLLRRHSRVPSAVPLLYSILGIEQKNAVDRSEAVLHMWASCDPARTASSLVLRSASSSLVDPLL